MVWELIKFHLKKWWAKFRLKECIKSEQSLYRGDLEHFVLERPRVLDADYSTDVLTFFGQDQTGNSLLIQILRRRSRESEVWLILRLQDGRTFTLPDHPDTQLYNVRNDSFSAGGLSMETMIPFISTRITFNGLLRSTIRKKWRPDYGEDELWPVKFNLIFSVKSQPLYWPYDWNIDLMATAVASECWKGINFLELLTETDSRGYEQYGAMRGEIILGLRTGSETHLELNMPGVKIRRWGKLPVKNMTATGYLIGVCGDGMVFLIGAFASKEGLKQAQFGSILKSDGLWETINWTDFNLDDLADANPGSSFIVGFRVLKHVYKVEIRTHSVSHVPLFRGRPIDWTIDQHSISFSIVDGPTGRGCTVFCRAETVPGYGPIVPDILYKTLRFNSTLPNPEKFIHLFFEEAARSVQISGGKGASLATLSILSLSADIADNNNIIELSDELRQRLTIRPPDFAVPEGFIISVSALQKTVQTSVVLETSIARLLTLSAEGKDIQWQCMDIYNQLRAMPMDTEIAHAVTSAFRSLVAVAAVPNKRKEFLMAVRSSSVSEDTREGSGAGQNDTVLGVTTERELLDAVKQCWASLYSFKSVGYRRQTMQPINTGMAVVVQTLVVCDCAGVLFSQNAATGDPGECLISANNGLGATVVSGEVDADQFVVRRSYNASQLTILSRKRGTKKIVFNVGKKGQLQRHTNRTKGLCLTDEMALKLARIGVILERLFSYPVDIEWGLLGGKFFLFQCRAITTLNPFTDWELKHEFDSAVMSNEDVWTTANVHEVLPHALTLPTMHFFISIVDQVLKKRVDKMKDFQWDVHRFMPCFNYHLFLDVFNFILRYNREVITLEAEVMGYALMGKDYLFQKIHRIALRRHPPNIMEKIGLFLQMLTYQNNVKQCSRINNAFKNYYSKEDLMDFKSSLSLLVDIQDNVWRLMECCRSHYDQSMRTVLFQTLAITLLSKGESMVSPDIQEDIRMILSGVNGTVSGEVPMQLEDIMRKIMRSGRKDEFCNVQRSMGVEWLKLNIPEAGRSFEEFIHINRHRGIEEMELFSTTWGMDPGIVIEMLQRSLSTIKTVDDLNNHKRIIRLNPNQIVTQMRTPLMWITKLVLRKIISMEQEAVIGREATKNHLTSVLHEFRLAFRHLSIMMTREALITTPKLFYFLTPKEWMAVIVNRDMAMVRKAVQRWRIFPELNVEQFPVIISGVPQPIRRSSNSISTSVGVQGTSAHPGIVTGRASIVQSFEESWKIKAGDILITRSADVGWSPYFPVIKGLVTEMGGLLSHGTIVAREYGLPCIVAATDATHFFEHGELVTLDADSGGRTSSKIMKWPHKRISFVIFVHQQWMFYKMVGHPTKFMNGHESNRPWTLTLALCRFMGPPINYETWCCGDISLTMGNNGEEET